MRKFFEEAELEIVKFANTDVITASEESSDVNIGDDSEYGSEHEIIED